jgi:predicted DNA-binding protein
MPKLGRPKKAHLTSIRMFRSSKMMLQYLRRNTGWTTARVLDEALFRLYKDSDGCDGQAPE